MASALKQYLLVMVAALSLVFMPVAANAQYAQLACNNTGGVALDSNGNPTQFFYADQLNQQGACQYQGIQHIFSQIICNFIVIVNSVMGQMYCGIQYALTPVLAILLSLYIAIFGLQVLMGTAQLNSKEIVIRLLKVAGVWALATQSTWGIGIAFQFFFGAAAQGSMWVVNAINPALTAAQPTSGNFGNFMVMFQFIDGLIYSAILGPFTQANDKVIGFFICMMFFFPSLFGLACTWLITTILLLTRTLVEIMQNLSIIGFLSALGFIFTSFMLFQPTNYLFEDWLKHLITYAIRTVVVLAIISLWVAVMTLFGGFFNVLSDLVMPINNVKVTNVFSPDNTFGICQYETPMSYSLPNNAGPCVSGLPCLPLLVCDGSGTVLTPSQLLQQEDFIYFMAYNLTVLVAIAYAFNILMNRAPEIASSLSGPATVPELGGGFGMKDFGQISGSNIGAMPGKAVNTPPRGSGNAVSNFLGNAGAMLTGRSNANPARSGGAPSGPRAVNFAANTSPLGPRVMNLPVFDPGAPPAWANLGSTDPSTLQVPGGNAKNPSALPMRGSDSVASNAGASGADTSSAPAVIPTSPRPPIEGLPKASTPNVASGKEAKEAGEYSVNLADIKLTGTVARITKLLESTGLSKGDIDAFLKLLTSSEVSAESTTQLETVMANAGSGAVIGDIVNRILDVGDIASVVSNVDVAQAVADVSLATTVDEEPSSQVVSSSVVPDSTSSDVVIPEKTDDTSSA